MRLPVMAVMVLAGCVNSAAVSEQKPVTTALASAPVAPQKQTLPPGCEASLTGEWSHVDDPSFVYAFTDDGGSVTFTAARRLVIDAGPDFSRFRRDAGPQPQPPAPKKKKAVDAGVGDAGTADAGPSVPAVLATGELSRATALQGTVAVTAELPSGQQCTLTFAIKVASCVDGGLLLETETQRQVSASCEPSDAGTEWIRQSLRRTQP